ncbi:Uncharacterized protein APZ42_005305 [Daphnia magna]|uniref:Uncharacterized protein n=1 Tax=Daphnia magna TaxID=35525 RepID=A0A0P5ZYB0_9CRUS|nr:Uncharacterized protein APZ42_005305 [Daphnia magna]
MAVQYLFKVPQMNGEEGVQGEGDSAPPISPEGTPTPSHPTVVPVRLLHYTYVVTLQTNC